MAVAGVPAIAAPWAARSASSHAKSGARLTATPSTTAAIIAIVSARCRPSRSATMLHGSTASASPPVAADTDSAA